MVSGTWLEPDNLRARIRETREATSRPFGVNLGLEWPQEERLEICLEMGVRIISLFWGSPGHLVAKAHDGGALVMHTVGSALAASEAVAAGVDILVAQGWEAGGHLDSKVGNLALVPAVVDVAGTAPVVAAGGIADGRGLAAVLALGASGAWIGTRFLLSEEAGAHDRYKRRLLEANETDTVFSTVFDVGWSEAPHRTLVNDTVQMWEEGGRRPMGERPNEGEVIGRYADDRPITRYDVGFPRADADGAVDSMALYAGQGVGLLTDIVPAAEIVSRIETEAIEVAGRLAGRVTERV